MYIPQLGYKSQIYLILHVNEMLIAGRNQTEIRRLKQSLHDKFSMKKLGQDRHILGMRIERNQMMKILRLSPFDYIWKVLTQFNMENVKPMHQQTGSFHIVSSNVNTLSS